MKRTPIKPGIYPKLAFEDYLALDAWNHSDLKVVGAKSAMHAKYRHDNPDPADTDSKRLGTAEHAMLLEPATFEKKLVPAPINEKTQKPYGSDTNAWREYAAKFPGKFICGDEELANLKGMARAVLTHADTKALFTASGLSEVTIVWDEDGVLCKIRIDRMPQGFGRVDLKTCESAAGNDIANALVKYGYHTSDALYRRGCLAHKLPADGVLAFVESSAPYGVRVVEIAENTHKAADAMVGEWLEAVRRAQKSGEWPGYPTGIHAIDAPVWWLKRFADAEL